MTVTIGTSDDRVADSLGGFLTLNGSTLPPRCRRDPSTTGNAVDGAATLNFRYFPLPGEVTYATPRYTVP
jgi:hypothetical protein